MRGSRNVVGVRMTQVTAIKLMFAVAKSSPYVHWGGNEIGSSLVRVIVVVGSNSVAVKRMYSFWYVANP